MCVIQSFFIIIKCKLTIKNIIKQIIFKQFIMATSWSEMYVTKKGHIIFSTVFVFIIQLYNYHFAYNMQLWVYFCYINFKMTLKMHPRAI